MENTLLSRLELLRRVPLFAYLTPTEAEVISCVVVKARFNKGDALVQQGQPSESMYILLNGRVRVIATDSRGREVILNTLGPGDHLGEMSMLDNQAPSATVVADIETDVLSLTRSQFLACVKSNFSVGLAVMRALVKRLRQADQKIESLALMDVYGRVAHALLENKEELFTDAVDQRTIIKKISKQDLAKMVGASREMVSRVLKDLEDQGYIKERSDGRWQVHTPLDRFIS